MCAVQLKMRHATVQTTCGCDHTQNPTRPIDAVAKLARMHTTEDPLSSVRKTALACSSSLRRARFGVCFIAISGAFEALPPGVGSHCPDWAK